MTGTDISILLRQTFEIRLAIYNHLPLPPFDGYKEYSRFYFLTCRQIKAEVERESLRRLNIFFDGIENNSTLLDGIRIKRPRALGFDYLRNINITIPFRLPESHWYRQIRPAGCGLGPSELKSYPYGAEERHRTAMIAGINGLRRIFELDVAHVYFTIEADETTACMIRSDRYLLTTQLFSVRCGAIDSVSGTLFGQLIGFLESAIIAQSSSHLNHSYSDGKLLRVPKMTLEWNFTGQENPQEAKGHEEVCCSESDHNGTKQKQVFRKDRLVGRTVAQTDCRKYMHCRENNAKRLAGLLERLSGKGDPCRWLAAEENALRKDYGVHFDKWFGKWAGSIEANELEML